MRRVFGTWWPGVWAGILLLLPASALFGAPPAYATLAGAPAKSAGESEGAILHGRVLSASGEAPLPGAEIRVRAAEWHFARADEEGRFSLRGLQGTEAHVHVVADRHALAVERVPLSAGEPSELTLTLDLGWTLAGRVVDPDGHPVAGAVVRIRGDRLVERDGRPVATWEASLARDRAVSGCDGRFRFDSLYLGGFDLTAEHPDHPAWRAEAHARSGDEAVRLELGAFPEGPLVLAGHVRDARTRQPVESFTAWVRRPRGGGRAAGLPAEFRDREGAFRLTHLEPGDLELAFEAPGYARKVVTMQRYGTGEHAFGVWLWPDTELRLRLVDRSGRPIAGARLAFADSAGLPLQLAAGVGARLSHLLTTETGEAVASGLPATTVRLRAESPDSDAVWEWELDLSEVRGRLVELEAPPRPPELS